MADNGVTISPKEMYDLIQEAMKSLQRIESRLEVLESKMESANKVDERSQEALDKAEDALALAERIEHRIWWVAGVIIAEIIVGAITALFYFAQRGLGG
ncbi:hypothetical protein [Lihuaxuella thermophila]|uniref:Haemolysin XhlA n=1 Tax=Lihuaxuella thermophila TaxID=1173111 RepID=A0A1H8AUP1_9BACL|nr:hypothetical protein [Lihuaxuella thermophila]SEM74462.1 hypothetical protein SAMN05444955_101365 [Lihuaxuella thermophila]